MRENQLNTCNFEMALSKNPKPALVSVSSNVYYGYQALPVQDEPMQTEAFTPVCRKRSRSSEEQPPKNWKRHRQNECAKLGSQPLKVCSLTKSLEEDLLRETHGCSYYHWISANN